MAKINQEMKDREEKTKRKIEELNKENEETIKLIKANFQKQLEEINKDKREKMDKIRQENQKKIEDNKANINQILNRYGYDLIQLMNQI